MTLRKRREMNLPDSVEKVLLDEETIKARVGELAAQISADVGGIGGSDPARKVRRGRGDRAAEGPQERIRERVGRHADRHRGESRGCEIGEPAVHAAAQHEGQRAGPERGSQSSCGVG